MDTRESGPTGNEQEKGLEDKKVEYEGIDTEGMNEKVGDIEDSETQDKICYSRGGENLLDKVNNRKIGDIEIKEIEIETDNEQEKGLEDKKIEYECIATEEMREKISDIEIVGIF